MESCIQIFNSLPERIAHLAKAGLETKKILKILCEKFDKAEVTKYMRASGYDVEMYPTVPSGEKYVLK